MIDILLIIISVFIFYSFFISLVNVFWKEKKINNLGNHKISVLIPARNEGKNISKCVKSILKSKSCFLEILIYNDHSDDNTQIEIDKLLKLDKRIKQANTETLSKGWIGKSFACYQLAKQSQGDWILFVDADTEFLGKIESMVFLAKEKNLSMLSAWPKIKMDSLSEKIFMPLLNFVVFSLCPVPFSEKINSKNLGLAHGACILFNKKVYSELGGHKLVKNDLFEDTRLARIWRVKNEKNYCIDGKDLISVKMYSSFTSIWNGFLKNYYPSFSKEVSFFIFQIFFFISYFVLPIYIIFRMINTFEIIEIILLIFIFLPRIIISIKFKHSLLSVILHPFAILTMIILGFNSWWNFKYGKGLKWKDRIYEK